MIIIGVGDASYKQDDKAIGGIFLFLANSSMTCAAPIFWKSKQIERVCHSSKDAETLNLLKIVDDSVLAAHQLELLLYGEVINRIPIRLYTDSESTLESVECHCRPQRAIGEWRDFIVYMASNPQYVGRYPDKREATSGGS